MLPDKRRDQRTLLLMHIVGHDRANNGWRLDDDHGIAMDNLHLFMMLLMFCTGFIQLLANALSVFSKGSIAAPQQGTCEIEKTDIPDKRGCTGKAYHMPMCALLCFYLTFVLTGLVCGQRAE